MLKKSNRNKYIIGFAFILLLLVGIFVYRDYGVTVDEPIQRIRSLVTYKYIMSTLFGRDIPALATYPLTATYRGQYYGVFLQLPMVLIEDLTGFTMELQSVWFMRHFITFFYCFLGYLSFYFMSRKIFRNDWLALLGTAMLLLYPRFFASQFFYIKDTLFAATVMASMWATVMYLEKGESFGWGVVFCIVTAISTNLRFIGLIFPALLIGYLFIRDLFVRHVFRQSPRAVWKRIGVYAALGTGFLLTYLAISPACWTSIFRSFAHTILQFVCFDGWKGTSVLAGGLVPWDAIPWYYIPLWLLVSLPIVYLLLFAVSLPLFLMRAIRSGKAAKLTAVSQVEPSGAPAASGVLGAMLAAPFHYWIFAYMIFFVPLLLVILNHSVIYNDWRQMYFLLVPLILCCLFALQQLLQTMQKKFIRFATVALLISCLIFQAGWICVNHPFEIVFFNRAAAAYGDQFDRDTARSSVYSALQYLAAHAPEDEIILNSSCTDYQNVIKSIALLPAEQRKRFGAEESGEYIIETYRNIIGNAVIHEGYDEWASFSVDKFHVVTIFKKSDN
ncbi:MAG: hypothetical protein GX417_00090 [Clostridiales bacterium]|nr:hypothetical protein [Clostridiales bacterium]